MPGKKGRRRRTGAQHSGRKEFLPWRRLDNSDIDHVLEMANLKSKLDADAKLSLKHSINNELAVWDGYRRWRHASAPHRRMEELRRIQRTVAELQAALRSCPNIDDELAYAVDRLTGHPYSTEPASLERLRLRYPHFSESMLGAAHGVLLPSDEATASVTTVRLSVDLLSKLTMAAEETQLKRQAKLGTKQKPQQADYFRYLIIMALARIYKRFFGVPPTTSRESKWCGFLAAVLTRCEGQIDNDGAYDIWRKAKRWAAAIDSQLSHLTGGG
jgi:hypothetical protein